MSTGETARGGGAKISWWDSDVLMSKAGERYLSKDSCLTVTVR